jgi:hypothetical protein
VERILVPCIETLGSCRFVVSLAWGWVVLTLLSEATINNPLLYARGWGKQQCYCLCVDLFLELRERLMI